MNAAHAIERAEHCLRTGQPNLAVLYMRRASELVAADHTATLRAIRRARLRAATTPFAVLSVAFEEVDAALQETWAHIAEAFANLSPNPQNHYALAGPSKGGTNA